MIFLSYFDSIGEGIEYMLAIGSIIGLLGLLFGIILFIYGGKKYRVQYVTLIIISIIILSLCGGRGRGIRYFRLH